MAHVFKIAVSQSDRSALFNGYCDGLMYKSFGHPECDAGLSGTGEKLLITKEVAETGLKRAITKYSASSYTDDRISEIRTFAENMRTDPAWTTYEICFCDDLMIEEQLE